MKIKFKQIKDFFKKLSFWLPTKLPTGMTEFKEWSDSIVYTYGFPDNDSLRFTLAAMIMDAPPGTAYRSKHRFAKSVIKAMANQIASGVMYELKQKQKAEEAAAAKAAAELAAIDPNTPPQCGAV